MSTPSRFPFALRLAACGTGLALATVAFGIHPQNAGPSNVEIKFKLPPPKPLTAEEELTTFKIQPGFHAELVASEPMVQEPIAMSWDEKGRLFVCEMRGYMQDVDGKGEDQPVGRIVTLEDTDGDGKMDKRTVFADELVMPRAVACVNGGVLVGEPPMLWFMKDTDGDGKADVKEPVDTHFGSKTGQPEHMANSPTVMLDNWVYSANHSTRYRFKDGKWLSEPVPMRGQWGMTQDDRGNRYYNFNSDFLRGTFVPEQLYQRNPNFPASAGAGLQVLREQYCWPSHPTPGVNRGYDPAALRSDGTLKSCTATCGAGIYRASLFPKEFAGNAFIPEPSGNLVKRVSLAEKDGFLKGTNAYDGEEFWTSTDERFRPVNAYTGPEGALYVVDMYRGVIQHKGFLTYYLVKNIQERNLELPFDGGRIWRIVPDGAKPVATKLPTDTDGLVKALGDSNGWVRDTAQRLLVEKKDAAALPGLQKTLREGSQLAKIHALWVLEGAGLPATELIAAALKDADPLIRANAVRVADRTMEPQLVQMIGDSSREVKIALAFALSAWPEAQDAVVSLARANPFDVRLRDALISGLRGRELEVLEALLNGKPVLNFSNVVMTDLVADPKEDEAKPDRKADPAATKPKPAAAKPMEPDLAAASSSVVYGLAQAVLAEKRTARVKKLITLISAQPADSFEQLALLFGASGKAGAKLKGLAGAANPKVKLLYLDAESPELSAMKKTVTAKAQPLLAALDARLAWPNKPGVPPPPVIKPLTVEEQALFETGKTVYNTLCGACHQPTGVGMQGLAPALVDSEWVLGNEKVLPRIVLHGLGGPIKIDGQVWNLEMPPLGAALSDEQIAGVLTYIRREWEHGANPVTIKTVKDIRDANKDRTVAWTAEELTALTKTAGKPGAKPAPKPAEDAPEPSENATGAPAASAN